MSYVPKPNKKGEVWLPLAAAWLNDDGSIDIKLEQSLREGERFRLFPNRFKQVGDKAPELKASVRQELYDAQEMQLLREDRSDSPQNEAATAPGTVFNNDDIPF